ncbi:MAG TPA: hypothetical protein VHK24_11030, partial [Steroidobacter sp.]|nr:hypothetical protein [Steroidobacter sp.]
MSPSVDESGESARNVLASWLEDYSEGRCELEDLRQSLLSICRTDPDAPWDALALLDQYTRRGRITPDLAQVLKTDVERLVFGDARASTPSEPSVLGRAQGTPARAEPVSDVAGSSGENAHNLGKESAQGRVPQPSAECEADSTRSGAALIERTAQRHADEPRLPHRPDSGCRRAAEIQRERRGP